MAYEDLKTTILNNYGGQDNVPDSVYNALLKYKQNGQDALDDRDYSILTEAKSYSPAPSTYQFQPGQREDLIANLHEVGYSGLDDTQKALYKQQYDASDYAKAGHSFQEAIDLADRSARSQSGISFDTEIRNPIDAAKNIYGGVRDFLSYPATALLSIPDAFQTTVGGVDKEGFQIAVPRWPDNPSYAERLGRSQEEMRPEAQRGEGLAGFLSDPLNATFLIPGLGETVLGSKLATTGKIGKLVSEYPVASELIGKGVLQGVEGAGMGYASSKLDNTRAGEDAGKSALIGGVAGSILSPLGVMLKGHAVENFPGAEKLSQMEMKGIKNTGLMQLNRGQREQILQDVGSISTLPSRKDYYNLGKEYISTAGKDYKVADKIFDEALEKSGYPHGAVTVDDVKSAMKKAIIKESKAGGRLQNKTNLEDIESYINDKIKNISFTASQTPRKLHSQYEKLLTAQDVVDIPKKVVPISNMGSILGELNTDIGGLTSKNPTAQRQMALAAHEGIVEDILGRNADNTGGGIFFGQLPVKDVNGNIVYDASGNPLLQSYNDYLDPMTREKYKLGSALLKNIANQSETGPRGRLGIPGLGEVGPHFYGNLKSNYVMPSLQYKLGQQLSDNIGLQLVPERMFVKDKDKKKK